MAQQTTNLDLTKPGGGSTGTITPAERVDIDVINDNMDKIDEWAGDTDDILENKFPGSNDDSTRARAYYSDYATDTPVDNSPAAGSTKEMKTITLTGTFPEGSVARIYVQATIGTTSSSNAAGRIRIRKGDWETGTEIGSHRWQTRGKAGNVNPVVIAEHVFTASETDPEFGLSCTVDGASAPVEVSDVYHFASVDRLG